MKQKINTHKLNLVKIVSLSLIASSLLATTITPVTNWNYYPLNKESTAQTRGGDTQDKTAIQDGVGAILIHGVVSNKSTMDNTTYNQLLYKNKEALSSTTLKALIENNTITLSNDEIAEINVKNEFINPNARGFIPDNTPCDDNEIQTIGDKYVNGVCAGINVEGQSCDDSNAQTINEIYVNGVCIDTKVNGTTCDDQNAQTTTDTWLNGTCSGIATNLFNFTTHTFTNCNQTGYTGPSLESCRAAYSTTWDEDNNNFNMTVNGYQLWTVPQDGTYRIVAAGARGANISNNNYMGGNGVIIQGDFILNKNDKLKILVGQVGQSFVYTGGGGGASLVMTNSNTPLIVAGGGGGAGTSGGNGFNATYNINGVNGYPNYASGINGYGSTNNINGGWGQSGSGFYGNGNGYYNFSYANGNVATSLNTTGLGATNPSANVSSESCNGAAGGFGGGASGACNGGGGGGGYSGGGAGGGAGGSYNNGTNKQNIGYNNNNGYVIITKQ